MSAQVSKDAGKMQKANQALKRRAFMAEIVRQAVFRRKKKPDSGLIWGQYKNQCTVALFIGAQLCLR
ncbi:hypothetical protein [Pseudomonas sp. PS02288]|uniref:hypothetical protein n=1 Tax=Pseudomonas sp. PS02288 TaxID=2991443 RepID=UPI00249A273F|nr:hypothetical protein [Pseudomonas sp. PS02288]